MKVEFGKEGGERICREEDAYHSSSRQVNEKHRDDAGKGKQRPDDSYRIVW